MVKCPKCGTIHVANTLICSKCATLLFADGQETDPVGNEVITELIDQLQANVKPVPSATPDTTPLAIYLNIGPNWREVEFSLNKSIYLGREDPAGDVYPEVDLSYDGDRARTVSRLHAKIFKQRRKVVIEDLQSTNGTFVNNIRLRPLLPQPLNDGDILQLGTLQILVGIKRQ
jgi:pSer/pThr/pTyr-binding forkhead associated (FHA) protein